MKYPDYIDESKMFFDQYGRRVPPTGMQSSIVTADPSHHFDQPEKIDFTERLSRLQTMLRLKKPIMSAAQFEDQAALLKEYIQTLPGCANIFNGIHLPITAHRLRIEDIGQTLERSLLPAVKRSYISQFPNRWFKNHRQGEIKGKIKVVDESRYDIFLSKLKTSPLIWWYFPSALQGFGIEADREQMRTLPSDFILTGPVSMSFAFIMYPDVLARDNMVPLSDCAAVQWLSPEYSLYFYHCDSNRLVFDFGRLHSCGFFSGGILVLPA